MPLPRRPHEPRRPQAVEHRRTGAVGDRQHAAGQAAASQQQQVIGGRIERQMDRIHTYYETATYFGPDRRNRTGGPKRTTGSDHGGGQYRRIEIKRNPDTSVDVIRDDLQVVL